MGESKMLAEKQDGIGRMIFNNPERHNAVSLDMWDAAEEILNNFVEDESIRVVVLAGAGGKAFVSGADISKFDSERGSKEAVLNYNKRVGAVYRFVHEFPKPTIVEVNGYCTNSLVVIKDCLFASSFTVKFGNIGAGYECLSASTCKNNNPYTLVFNKVVEDFLGGVPHIQGNSIVPFWIIENHPTDTVLLFS
jgi:1,4-dihydroxy-2-naphthoyl-CoA synthase